MTKLGLPPPGVLFGLAKLLRRNSCTPIHVCCFKEGGNRYRILDRKTNTFWHRLAEPLGRFPFNLLCSAHCIYSRFHPNSFRFEAVITKKTLPRPSKVNGAYNYSECCCSIFIVAYRVIKYRHRVQKVVHFVFGHNLTKVQARFSNNFQ